MVGLLQSLLIEKLQNCPDLPMMPKQLIDIYYISLALFITLARWPDYEIYAILIANINKALKPKVHTNLTTKVLADYYDLLYVFS
jgi:hypothetical protein